MSRRVLFNGAVLIRPGAATKIDASQFENIALGGLGIVGLIGEAHGGESRVVKVFTDAPSVRAHYLKGDLVEAAAIAADPSNDQRITAGASVIVCYKVNNGVQASLSVDTGKVVFKDRNYGLPGNSITVANAVGTGSSRIVTVETLDAFGVLQTETSPELGATGKFKVQYVGAGSACTLTLVYAGSVMTLTTAVTGGPGGEALNLSSVNYPKLSDLIRAIDALAAYTCSTLIANDMDFDIVDLDIVTAIDIRTSETTLYARVFDVADWANSSSNIVSATATKGSVGPVAVLAKTALAGGTYGTSDNTAWANAFTAMAGLRINQLVPLASEDGATVGTGGTYTISSILAALVTHCRTQSSTGGRNERQGWVSLKKTKANLITDATINANTEHVCILGQAIKRLKIATQEVEFLPYWSAAVALAGLRAGAPLGEPLTWKFINCSGVVSDTGWSEGNNTDVQDLTLNGVIVINEIRGQGYRIDKCITTFTRLDNDAYTEETIVQIWKLVAYEWRTALETRYTGRPGTVKQVSSVTAFSASVFEKLRDAGAITDSIEAGTITKAYRNIAVALSGDQLSVGATISPTPGINFILSTLVLVPARMSF
jgi:hypothetical protein